MTHVEARKWIKRLPEGRGQALDAGAKAVLQELWDRVDWSIQHDTDGRECYPSRRRLAEDTGATVDVVKRRLATLAAAGWIRRERDGWALAWARPFEVAPVTRSAGSVTQVADHAQQHGHSTPRPRPLDSPAPATRLPGPGHSTPRIPSQNQVTDQPSDQATPPAPDPDPRGAGSPMQGSETAQGHPCKGEPSTEPEQPPKPRRRRSPAEGQAAFDLGAAQPEPDAVTELLALHGRLRSEALAHHGERVTALPKPTSNAGRSMASGIRAALKSRGEPWCRRMLEWRGRGWLDDASQLAWSTTAVWTKPSLEAAERRMGQPARASPSSRAPRLSAPPPGDAPEYVPSFKPGSENDPCETF